MIKIEIHNKILEFKDNDEFKSYLVANDLKLDLDGNIFIEENVGVIPKILELWFDERVQYRQLAKKYKKEGNEEKFAFYNRRQLRQKIFLNSIYGVTGLPVFRFYDRDNAEAVTTSGQTIIRGSERLVNQIYKEKISSAGKIPMEDYVIYLDTDSNYFSMKYLAECEPNYPEDMKAYSIEKLTYISGKINEFYKSLIPSVFNVIPYRNRIKIVGDAVAKTALWVAKKRYAMLKVYDMEVMSDVTEKSGRDGKIEVKGIDTVRSSFPAAFRAFASEFLDMLLRGKPQAEIDAKVLEFEASISSISIENIGKTTSVKYVSLKGDRRYDVKTRPKFQFEKATPVGVKSALAYNDLLAIWKLDKQYEPIHHGQKIKWLYVQQNGYGIDSIAFRADDTDPDKILEFINSNADKVAMYDSELKSKLLEFYAVMRWDFPNTSSKLSTDFFGSNEVGNDW